MRRRDKLTGNTWIHITNVGDRSSQSSNYLVLEEGASDASPQNNESPIRERVDDNVARRCSICHQPLKHVNLVDLGGAVSSLGSDCLVKLFRFKDTGLITSENPDREMWDEQSRSIVDVIVGNVDSEEVHPRKRRTIVASMFSWLNDHLDDGAMPVEIKNLVMAYKGLGVLPNVADARRVSEYYKRNRMFTMDEVLTDKERVGLARHRHLGLMENVIEEGVPLDKVPQLKRIIAADLSRQIVVHENLLAIAQESKRAYERLDKSGAIIKGEQFREHHSAPELKILKTDMDLSLSGFRRIRQVGKETHVYELEQAPILVDGIRHIDYVLLGKTIKHPSGRIFFYRCAQVFIDPSIGPALNLKEGVVPLREFRVG